MVRTTAVCPSGHLTITATLRERLWSVSTKDLRNERTFPPFNLKMFYNEWQSCISRDPITTLSKRTLAMVCYIALALNTDPSTTAGYFMRNQAANIPPYEPPNANTGLGVLRFPARSSRRCFTTSTKSAIACCEVR